jgi:hypothetical protein
MGAALTQAQSWLARRSDDIPEVNRAFTVLSRKAKYRKRVLIGLVMLLMTGVGAINLWPSLNSLMTQMEVLQMLRMEEGVQAVIALETLVANIEADEMKAEGKPGKATASALGEISRYQLYARKPDKALAAAERALSIVPGVLTIEASRAHALMFLNNREEALALYLAHKDKPIGANDDKSWQKAIAEDFIGFRKADLRSPLMDEIEEMLGVNREKSSTR